jgi:hypothetical protein
LIDNIISWVDRTFCRIIEIGQVFIINRLLSGFARIEYYGKQNT